MLRSRISFRSYHPWALLFGILFYLLAILFTQNHTIMEFILLLNLWKSVKFQSNLWKKVTIFGIVAIVFNNFCGKLLFLVKICILIGYIIPLKNDLSKKVLPFCYEKFFYRKKNFRYLRVYLTVQYFPKICQKCYQEINNSINQLDLPKTKRQFLYKVRQIFYSIKIELKKIYLTYQLRLYHHHDNRTLIVVEKWTEEDNSYFLVHLLFLTSSILLRRYL